MIILIIISVARVDNAADGSVAEFSHSSEKLKSKSQLTSWSSFFLAHLDFLAELAPSLEHPSNTSPGRGDMQRSVGGWWQPPRTIMIMIISVPVAALVVLLMNSSCRFEPLHLKSRTR